MIYYITGGQRSGKSGYGEQLALSLADNPIYLATSRQWDNEYQKRIDKHKATRDARWQLLEEEKLLSQHDFSGRVVLVDCITLWLTNFFVDSGNDVEASLELAKAEFDVLIGQNATFIFISNEIGMGTHANTATGRKFTDLQGEINQYIAEKADQAWLIVSGVPVRLI